MDWIRGRQHQIPVCRADNLSFYQCKKSNYQREGFIIQCEGLDEATGEKEYTMLWKQNRNRNWLSGWENLPELLLGYHQYHDGDNEYSYRDLFR